MTDAGDGLNLVKHLASKLMGPPEPCFRCGGTKRIMVPRGEPSQGQDEWDCPHCKDEKPDPNGGVDPEDDGLFGDRYLEYR